MRLPVLKGHTRSKTWRRLQLQRLEKLLNENENEIISNLGKDLEKPATEAFFELIALKQELKLAQESLNNWMQPQKVNVPFSLKPGIATTKLEPLGCILIIGPWNYPFSLTMQPLISALAAGNAAVLKPSENAPHISTLINRIIPKYFSEDIVRVFEGNGEIAEELISKSFDHIFFTGGGEVGKKVLKAAANHLTPVTLELGGKSPAIVLDGARIEITAKRLVWGKGLNAGQTCIAPNHILVQENLYSTLVSSMKKASLDFYGPEPLQSIDLGKIVNEHHFQRLKKLLDYAKDSKRIIFGGEVDEARHRISPTLIEVKNREDPLMKEEIFGPLMPIFKLKNLEEELIEIRKQDKPLAIYLFGGSDTQQKAVINTTSSGGICINDVVLQAGIPELPFGGVGASGMGQYHGYAGFETFSHRKSIFRKPFWLDINFRYPPYRIDPSLIKKII